MPETIDGSEHEDKLLPDQVEYWGERFSNPDPEVADYITKEAGGIVELTNEVWESPLNFQHAAVANEEVNLIGPLKSESYTLSINPDKKDEIFIKSGDPASPLSTWSLDLPIYAVSKIPDGRLVTTDLADYRMRVWGRISRPQVWAIPMPLSREQEAFASRAWYGLHDRKLRSSKPDALIDTPETLVIDKLKKIASAISQIDTEHQKYMFENLGRLVGYLRKNLSQRGLPPKDDVFRVVDAFEEAGNNWWAQRKNLPRSVSGQVLNTDTLPRSADSDKPDTDTLPRPIPGEQQ